MGVYRRAEAHAHPLLRRRGKCVGALRKRGKDKGDAEDELHFVWDDVVELGVDKKSNGR
jgi:hypothetical protein